MPALALLSRLLWSWVVHALVANNQLHTAQPETINNLCDIPRAHTSRMFHYELVATLHLNLEQLDGLHSLNEWSHGLHSLNEKLRFPLET